MLYRKSVVWSVLVILSMALAGCSDILGWVNGAEEPTAEHTGTSVHWGYEGEAGPENWSHLSEHNAACGNGQEQSPVNLTEAELTDLSNIVLNYADSEVTIHNNGHTIQVEYDNGSTAEINGETYALAQFHFHAPSEHTLNGVAYPLEMHLVHRDGDNLAVIGVFIAEGAENPAFEPVWSNLPHEEGRPTAAGARINAANLLPADQTFYRYNGSLTTPPCSEGVLWSVMQEPVEMSREQIAMFTGILEGNNRPLQDLNARTLQLDATP